MGEITDVENDPLSKGSKIWLSEPSMVASSLAPGSLVSVTFHSLSLQFHLLCFSLIGIAKNCGYMQSMQPQLLLRCGFGSFENHDIVAVIAVADHNLKSWS